MQGGEAPGLSYARVPGCVPGETPAPQTLGDARGPDELLQFGVTDSSAFHPHPSSHPLQFSSLGSGSAFRNRGEGDREAQLALAGNARAMSWERGSGLVRTAYRKPVGDRCPRTLLVTRTGPPNSLRPSGSASVQAAEPERPDAKLNAPLDLPNAP